MAEPEPQHDKVVTEGPEASSDMKVKKRVIKQYDKEGKLVSEQEVNN